MHSCVCCDGGPGTSVPTALVSTAWEGLTFMLCVCAGPGYWRLQLSQQRTLGVGLSQQITEWPEPGGDLTVTERNREELCCQQQEVGEK